ncbi:Ferredoxin--NADP reductase [Planctomycetes bacterium Pan216]|uniref:Ferredoxin--NADP reductase n=1 Tax=Kolteria novifilia TaxID=2527975 RepID=A0A518AY61_9BACT|nr:Ferredoxin--NADP reductase [Planctomycetes bacterium Pan216]
MQFDVAIVGAGPLGLLTALEVKRKGLSFIQFDKGCIGRTIEWFPRGMQFYSSSRNLELAGFCLQSRGPKPTREEYLSYLRAFVRYHELEIHDYHAVERIEGAKGDFTLHTTNRGKASAHRARAVVLATGSTEVPRRLGVPGEDLPHVSAFYRDPHPYFGQRVVIVGARNSACDAAIQLTHLGAMVTMVHRREEIQTRYLKYWIHPELTGMIRRGRIATRLGAKVTRIEPDFVEIESKSGERGQIEADFVLKLIGYEPDRGLIEQLGLETESDRRQPKVDPQTFESSVPGIHCAGTIVGGAQNPYRVFIENALHHGAAIANYLVGASSSGS